MTITRRAPDGRSAPRGITYNDTARGLGLVAQALRYAFFHTGMLGAVAAPIRAFVRSREGLEAPDVLLGWVPMLTEPGPRGPKISRQSGMTCYAHPMRPESKGRIHITSAEPRRPPAINFNFLSSPIDAEVTVLCRPHRTFRDDRARDGASPRDRTRTRRAARDR